MNKIAPGGLLKLKKKSKAIKKNKEQKAEATLPTLKKGKSLIVSIPMMQEMYLEDKTKQTTLLHANESTASPNNREGSRRSCIVSLNLGEAAQAAKVCADLSEAHGLEE